MCFLGFFVSVAERSGDERGWFSSQRYLWTGVDLVKKLTAAAIAVLKPKASPYDCLDREVPGLTVRTQPSGYQSYCLLYRVRGDAAHRLRRQTIGPVSTWTLDKARERAREVLQAASLGRNAGPSAVTFGDLANRFIEEWSMPRKRTWKQDKRQLEHARMAAWRDRPAASITSADVRALLDEVTATAPIAANRLRALLSKIFVFGVRRELVEMNPVVATEKPGQEQTRERVLSETEIRALWTALDDEPAHVASVFRLLLLTGVRLSEAANLKQDEIDGDTWVLPSSRSKNNHSFVVPLSAYTLTLAREIGPAFHIANRWRRIIERAGITNAHRHDLRRTAATGWSRLGTPPHLISELLNHSASGVTRRHYDRYSYQDEKRAALLRWERYLLHDVIGGAKVVAMRK